MTGRTIKSPPKEGTIPIEKIREAVAKFPPRRQRKQGTATNAMVIKSREYE